MRFILLIAPILIMVSIACKPGCGPDRIARLVQRIWKDENIVPAREYLATTVENGSPIRDGRNLNSRLQADPGSLSIASAASRNNTNHRVIAVPADQIDYWDRVLEQTTASLQFRKAAARVLTEIAFLAHEPYVETVMMLEQEL